MTANRMTRGSIAIVAASALLAAAISASTVGAATATWNDSVEQQSGFVGAASGVVLKPAGADQFTTNPGGTYRWTVPSAFYDDLADDLAANYVIEVEGLAQGDQHLTLAADTRATTGPLSTYATVSFRYVEEPAACTMPAENKLGWSNPQPAEPVHQITRTGSVETVYLCLSATLPEGGVEDGDFDDTVTAAGTSPLDQHTDDQDTWTATAENYATDWAAEFAQHEPAVIDFTVRRVLT